MGVSGLSTFIKDKSHYQSSSLEELIAFCKFPKRDGSVRGRLLIDSSEMCFALAHHYLTHPVDVTLPSYLWIDEWLDTTISRLQAEGITTTWFFDTSRPTKNNSE